MVGIVYGLHNHIVGQEQSPQDHNQHHGSAAVVVVIHNAALHYPPSQSKYLLTHIFRKQLKLRWDSELRLD